jgi:pyruvate,orthophosphate dikinase
MTKWVYDFGDGKAEGSAEMRDLLGGKGAGLAEMSNLGLPVPPGFTITTEVCTAFYAEDRSLPDDLAGQVGVAITAIEASVGATFGDPENPLLVSVRSGARASMPGMLDTILNLGLNPETVAGLAARSNDERFAFDSYRRFIQMYSNVVLGVSHDIFEELLENHKADNGQTLDTELTADDWIDLVEAYKGAVYDATGETFPDDVQDQLWGAINAVFGSWMNKRALTYRRLHDIPTGWGTAVNVQAMVFGNMGDDCATGVAFTRDPSSGEKAVYGEFLINAQGEDVVAGIRTPQHLTLAAKQAGQSPFDAMEEVMPEVYGQLIDVIASLESHYRDMQDIEFTVQSDKLWMLQTRSGKRTAQAGIRIAVEMVAEGIIDEREAILRVDPASLDQLLHPMLDSRAPQTIITRGLPASPGAASGRVVFTADAADDAASQGEAVILVRIETSPEDIHGMHAARGILTSRGGMTSHAAVVARGMGRPCVSGAGELNIDLKAERFSASGIEIKAGDMITIDGSSGAVMQGEAAMIQPELSDDFQTLMAWADKARRMAVRANADSPKDAQTALDFGAEGIGLCRTEHMFFEAKRITAMREMILADDEAARRVALDKLLPMQRDDFIGMFRIMAGLPVTIRLLDPPLHEFLPHSEEDLAEVARASGVAFEALRQRAAQIHEVNPMLGHRGCRLGISYPEIYRMQARAIFEASATVSAELGEAVVPEIMIPLIVSVRELEIIKKSIIEVAGEVEGETGAKLSFLVGTMIELPRAALRAGDIARAAEFFSFGTNDLTQTTYGISRDDSATFLEDYQRLGIFERDPFVSLDREGVGELVSIAVERGRAARADLKLGICGEHGGDPDSIEFCESVGLDYVSCSPFRVPIARLAAAQATLGKG